MKISLNEENKSLDKDVLNSQLGERYSSVHKLRDRLQSISFWILGVLLGISGWLTQGNLKFSCIEKSGALILLVVGVSLFIRYLEDLECGWQHQKKCIDELEKELGIPDKFLPTNHSESFNRRSLRNYYSFIAFGTIVTIICVLYFT